MADGTADDIFAQNQRMPKMKRIAELLFVTLFAAVACDGLGDSDPEDRSLGNDLSHDMIVLGKQLEDPYSVKNMTKALESLYPTKAGQSLHATDMYVRFLPETDQQMSALLATGLVLVDHPLDFQIIRDGDYYHDPLIDDGLITWQYAVVPADFKLPSGVRCEILDECYIPSSVVSTKADGLDWAEIEREAYRLTGNEEMILSSGATKASASTSPKGRITIVDPDANGGKAFGVAGVTVLCNSFVKFASATTDRDGYYEMRTKFASDVRYRLMFQNSKGFAIGFNLLLVPASTSALGKTTPEGIDCEITSASDRKLFSRAVVNNAVYDYYERCNEEDLGILPPPGNLRLWLFQNLASSSTPMLRQGTVLDQGLFKKYLGEYAKLISVFLPDITVGLKGADSYSDIYSMTSHELAHSSHYMKVGNAYWNKYINYIITSFVKNFGADYGTGNGEGAGHCEVGEDWGYFMQNLLYHDRYGGTMPSYGMSFWFHPQIFRYLNERGLSVKEIYKALDSDVTSKELLRDKLTSLYPSQASMINQVFTRYAE